MKNSISFFVAALILIFIIISCEKRTKLSSESWYEEDKKTFMKECTDNEKYSDIPKEKIKIYCECMMEKIMKKYPNYMDTYGRKRSDFKDMMKECDEKAGIENNE
jgi:hypothetical protein